MKNIATFFTSSDFKLDILLLYSVLLHVIQGCKQPPKAFGLYTYFSAWHLGFVANIQNMSLNNYCTDCAFFFFPF